MHQLTSTQKLFLSLIPLLLFASSCSKPPDHTYQSGVISVTFPGDFDVRQSDVDTLSGKVHKTVAVCTRAEADYAVITTAYPAALVASNSDLAIMQKELDLDLKAMDGTLSSSKTDTNTGFPGLSFTFTLPATIAKRLGEGRIYYRQRKSYLVSTLSVKHTPEVDTFLNSTSENFKEQ